MSDYDKFQREHPARMWLVGRQLDLENWWYGVRQRFWLLSSAACFIMGWDTVGCKLERRVNHEYFKERP